MLNGSGEPKRVRPPPYKFDSFESDGLKHRLNCNRIWPPPIRRIIAQLFRRIERHSGSPAPLHVHCCFKYQMISGDTEDSLETQQRMTHMVQDSGKQHQVKGSELFWGNI